MWDNLAIVDVETTGMWPHRDRVIEVGIVLINNGVVEDQYSQLINPHVFIPEVITGITGITATEVEMMPDFRDQAETIYQRLTGRVLVAHNVRFDYGFLKKEFERLGMKYRAKQLLCSARMSRALYPKAKGHSLQKIIERVGIKVERRHRALDDAKAVWEFFQHLEKTMEKEVLEKTKKTLIKSQSIPPLLGEQQLENLPHGPGVYLMYSEDGTLLYVGKSVDIRERVWSHFYDDLKLPKDFKIKTRVAKIEVKTTAGEVGALLLESRLIKELKPLLNSQLRQAQSMVVALKRENADGYTTIKYERKDKIDINDWNEIWGVYRSEAQAKTRMEKLTREFKLCGYLMGLEKRKPCFGHQLEQCQGACEGKEKAIKYNLRVQMALIKEKLMSWPFKGPIVIGEENEITGQRANHVFDQWCYLGDSFGFAQDGSFERLTPEERISDTSGVDTYVFDLDVYKILKRYLTNHFNQVKVLR